MHIDHTNAVLTMKEMRLFKAPTMVLPVNDINTGETMDRLARQGGHILQMVENPCQTNWTLWLQERSFTKRLDIFLPVAGEILAHEIEIEQTGWTENL